MTTVLFVRHGEREQKEEIVPFQTDVALTATGKEQIKNLSQLFSDRSIAAIYASPFLRCRQTAEIISKQSQIPFEIDERLGEVHSPFAGMEVAKYYTMLADRSLYKVPEQLEKGESAETIVARMEAFLDEMLKKYADKTVIAVSHGDPVMLLWCSLTGKDVYSLRDSWPEYVPFGAVYELIFDGDRLVSQRLILP